MAGTRPNGPVRSPDLPEDRHRPVDKVLGDDFLTRMPELEEAELSEMQDLLADTVVGELCAWLQCHDQMLPFVSPGRCRDGLRMQCPAPAN